MPRDQIVLPTIMGNDSVLDQDFDPDNQIMLQQSLSGEGTLGVLSALKRYSGPLRSSVPVHVSSLYFTT